MLALVKTSATTSTVITNTSPTTITTTASMIQPKIVLEGDELHRVLRDDLKDTKMKFNELTNKLKC